MQAQPKLEGMHCCACLHEETLRKSAGGAQSPRDSATTRISPTRRHPLVFSLPVLAHNVEEAERAPFHSNSSKLLLERAGVKAAGLRTEPKCVS